MLAETIDLIISLSYLDILYTSCCKRNRRKTWFILEMDPPKKIFLKNDYRLPNGHVEWRCQNLGASTPFKVKKGDSQLQTEILIMVVTCNMCLFSLYFVK